MEDNIMQKKRTIWAKARIMLLIFLVCSIAFSMETQAAKTTETTGTTETSGTTDTTETTKTTKKKPKIKVTSVKLKNIDSSIILEPGKSRTVKLSITPSNATNKKIKWKSSKPKVVSVTSKGKIKGLKEGKATITATAKDGSKKKAKLSVTVGYKVSGITFTNTDKITSLPVGQTFKLKTKVLPENAVKKSKKWTSSNEKVATVKSGVITAVGNGKATIKATAKDGSGKYASYKVKVITLAKSVEISNPTNRTYLQKGESVTLQPIIKPETTSQKSLTWTSDNTKVATVSSKGVVKGVGNGTTTIKATTKDGTKLSGKFTINVISMRKQDVKFVAHRGYSDVAPGNTAAAFSEAIANKFWGMECDIRKTKDGKIVVHHDASLLDDYGVNKEISQVTLEELQKWDIVSADGVDAYDNEKMLTLQDLMGIICTDDDINIFIELKDYYTEDELRELIDMVSEYNINDRVTFITYKAKNIKYLLKVLKKIEKEEQDAIDNETGNNSETEATTEGKGTDEDAAQPGDAEDVEKFVRPGIELLTNNPEQVLYGYANQVDWCIANQINISVKYQALTQEMVDKIHNANLQIGTFTINDFYTAFVYAKAVGVDTLTTDKKLFN